MSSRVSPAAGISRVSIPSTSLSALSGPEHVEREVDGRAVEIPCGVLPDFRGEAALQQLDEDGLQHVFRVLTMASDGVGRAMDHLAVLVEQLLEFLRQGLAMSDRCDRHRGSQSLEHRAPRFVSNAMKRHSTGAL